MVQIVLRFYGTAITITASIWRSIESVNSRLINHLKGFRELPMQDRIRFHSQKCGVWTKIGVMVKEMEESTALCSVDSWSVDGL